MATQIKQSKGDAVFDGINHILLAFIILAATYPLVFVLSASVSDPMAIFEGKVWLLPKNITFSAYKAVATNPDIMMGYRNTILYTVVGTMINLIMTVMGAYPLSKKDFFGRNFITILFTFTMFFSGGLIPTYLLIKNLNLYNNFWAMILPGAVGMWNLVIVRNYFQNSIPVELQEAAYMDGCSNTGTLLKVVLPLSKPILAVMVIFYGVGHWNQFFSALIYLSDRNKFPLQLILREILLQHDMNNMLSDTGENLAQQQLLAEALKYAVIVVASLPVLMLYPILQRYFVKGVMVGAIKG